jgi:hypothetical protein
VVRVRARDPAAGGARHGGLRDLPAGRRPVRLATPWRRSPGCGSKAGSRTCGCA